MKRRLPSWLLAVLLATPLLGLTAWVVHGAVARTHGANGAATARPVQGLPLPGLPAPQADLAAERLEDRVDGGADALRADGCRRLLHWRFEEPPSDAEVLVFRTAAGARAVLEREAGPERTAGPGEEAQATAQAVYFRRGPVLVRLFLDPGASAPADGLLRRAREMDGALVDGGQL